MNRIVDFDLKEKEWGQEIARRRELIADLDRVIAEKQRQKQKAEEDIAKFTEWIRYAREITGVEMVEVKAIKRITDSDVHPDSLDLGKVSLPRAIDAILRSLEGRKMKVGALRERLLNAGFKTASNDFTNVLRNTLNRLVKRGHISQAKDGYESLYYIGNQHDTLSLPSDRISDIERNI